LWWRWSRRDLRARWPLVIAIAMIIAIGTGTFAGLGSTAAWRRASNDASFAMLHMHDLRVTLAQGATVPEGALAGVVAGIPSARAVTGTEERYIAHVQVDASARDKTVLVPGEIVGVDVRHGPLDVDAVHVAGGRGLRAADDGRPVVVLEQKFADHYGMPPSGTVRLSGNRRFRYVGVGTAPQHFIVTGRSGMLFAQGGYAIVYAPLTTAQELSGAGRVVNELVLTVRGEGDLARVRGELRRAFARDFPTTGVTFTEKAEEPAYRMLYEDIENDQQFWNIIATLVLLGATFAAFNLTTRMVEAQRREIGIGMALGVPPARLARRPMLVGAQIAVLGVLGGVAVGLLLDLWLKGVFESVLPLPQWVTPFQDGVFARAALLGFVLPVSATAIPVWRAVRVQPVDAIRTGHLAARGGRLAAFVARLPLPGRTYQQMPVRNLSRTPRRTLLTALAIGAAITTLIAVIGIVDSFVNTIDEGEAELLHRAPDRLVVQLEQFVPVSSPTVQRIAASKVVREAQPGLQLFATVGSKEDRFDVVVDLVDFSDAMWSPTLEQGTRSGVEAGGLVLAEKAAKDLGVQVGDTVAFRHPRRVGLTYELLESRIRVAAVHPGPVRALAYLDASRASLFNVEGLANVVDVLPTRGVPQDAARRVLFSVPGVASVDSVNATVQQFRDTMDQYFGVLRVVELLVLLLALLIAFNSATIGIEERRRENATMLAYGLHPSTILSINAVETMVSGLLGTLIGIGAGYGVVQWMMQVQLDDTMPELGVRAYVSMGTILTALLFGVLAVGLAPLFAARRVRRMDIPSTLRVLE
jgi:putative ABC transport system permease protein